MDGIKIEVTGNIARITERPARITAGTVGLPVKFSFDSQWAGLSKTAVFRAGKTELIAEGLYTETTVPWEVLDQPNVWLSVGVYGVSDDGTVAIPTIWANVCVICEGVNPDGDVSTAPTLPVWQRLWNAVGNLFGLTTNAKDNLVSAINEVHNIALAGGIESDPTLSVSGKAADAKATGDKIQTHADDKSNPHKVTAQQAGALPTAGGTMTGSAKFIPENGTSVVTSEVYRNVPTTAPTASYMTRNVITNDGAATMQFYKGDLGTEPGGTPVNYLKLTETDTQLNKPLTVASGGTGRTSVTAGNYLVGNGTKGLVEKTPEAVLKDIGAASANDVAEFAKETWVNNQIAKAVFNSADVDLSGFVTKDGKTDMTNKLKFKPKTATSVISPEVYRDLPTGTPTASYMTRNVIAANGAAMQFFKGDLGTEPGGTPINQLTLTETDTQLSKPLTLSSGGTGIDLSSVPDGAVIRKAGKGNAYLHYTTTNNGAMYAESENGTPIFGTLPIAQGGTGATKPADVITNLGINDYVVAQGTSGGWRYRKWNSGIAECFLSSEVVPTSGAGEKYHSVNLPFEFYNKSYHVSVTGVKAANQNYAHDFLLGDSSSNDGRTTTSIMFHFHYTLATPYSVGFTIFVMGRWK